MVVFQAKHTISTALTKSVLPHLHPKGARNSTAMGTTANRARTGKLAVVPVVGLFAPILANEVTEVERILANFD